MFASYDDYVREIAYKIWQSRGSKPDEDLENWLAAESHCSLLHHYHPYLVLFLDGEHSSKAVIRSKTNEFCRFCHQQPPVVSFKNEAHAVPYFLGNRHVIAEDECDQCNKYFSETLEDHLAKMLSPFLTTSGVKGRRGIPTYKSRSGARVERDSKTLGYRVLDKASDPLLRIDDDNKTISLDMLSQPHIPILALKGLVKIALSVLPDPELVFFPETLAWIMEKDHERAAIHFKSFGMYFYEMEKTFDFTRVGLFRRVSTKHQCPFMLLFIGFGRFVIQVAVPLSGQDKHIKEVVVPRLAPGIFTQVFGTPLRCHVVMLDSSQTKRDLSFTLTMTFEWAEDVDANSQSE